MKKVIQAKDFSKDFECFAPDIKEYLARTEAEKRKHIFLWPVKPDIAYNRGPFEALPQCLMFSEETLPEPPVFYYGFPVSNQWLTDLGIKEKLEIFGPQKSDTPETRELCLYHIMTVVPSFLQKKSGIKSFTLLLRKIRTYVNGGKGYIITIRTNYFYKDGLVPTDDDVNKLRNILGKDENEKPKWYIGSLLREIQWCLGNGRGKVYPKSYLDYP